MKVALVTEWLDAWRGGAETSTQQFLHHLMDSGIELHVFTRSRPSPTPGMAVHSINGAAMSRTRRSITFGHRVERRIQSESFDVVHAITPCRFADIYQPRGGTVAESIERNIALRRPGSARRLKRHANRFNLKQRYMLRLERRLLGSTEGPAVVAISDYVARQLKAHYDLADDRIHRIYNGADGDNTPAEVRARHRAAIRKEFGIDDDDLLVLAVAHNFRLKGVHHWLEALASLKNGGVRGVRSVVVGRGESPAWRRLAARLDVAEAVTFVGPSDRMREFYHAADVLVHPTYYDPCSRVVLEAMVSSLPAVTTRWDGAAEMITDGENGFVLEEPTDVVGIAQKIERLQNAGLRRRVGLAAGLIADDVSMERHAAKMLKLYEDVRSRVGSSV